MLPALLYCAAASRNANPVCLWLTAGPRLFCFTASSQSKQDVCSYIFLILLLPWLLLVSRLAQPFIPPQGNRPIISPSPKQSYCAARQRVLAPVGIPAVVVRGGNPRSSESLSKAGEEMPDKFLTIRGREAPPFRQTLPLLHLRGPRTALQTAGKEPFLETAAPWGRAPGLMQGWEAPGRGHTYQDDVTHSHRLKAGEQRPVLLSRMGAPITNIWIPINLG